MNKAQRDLIFKIIGYQPTPEQENVHNSPARIRLVTGGERAGKSLLSAYDLATRFTEGKLYWLVAADYDRTGAEFNYLFNAAARLQLNPSATKSIDPGRIVIPGACEIVTKSAKDPRTLAKDAPDGVIVCEASQIDYETFLRLRGRLMEKRGWMLMSGTLESALGWYPEASDRWQHENNEEAESFVVPAWSNTFIYPGGRNDPEIKRMEALCSKEWFEYRLAGRRPRLSGLVFSEFRNAVHVGIGAEYEFDPNGEVFLWIDPGYGHYYAVEVIQKRGRDIWVIDEIYERGLVTSDIITTCQKREWWPKVVGGTVDIAARQHQAMPAVVEVWQDEARLRLTSNRVEINEGIERLKEFLKIDPITGIPSIHINVRNRGLISELGGCPNPDTGQTSIYRWRTDRDGSVIGEKPLDRNNDAIKAVIYGLVDLMGYSSPMLTQKVKVSYI